MTADLLSFYRLPGRLFRPSTLKWLCGLGCMATFLGAWACASLPVEVSRGVRVVINIPAAKLSLYEGSTLVNTYPVGVGQPRFPTPIGHFKVIRKTLNPGWENPYQRAGQVQIQPGQNNPLGTRWIGFHPGPAGEYGIHGTDSPASVGQFRSHGCVRMHNKDVVVLFERVKLGTPVHVIYEPFEFKVVQVDKRPHLQLVVYPNVYRQTKPWIPQVLARLKAHYPQKTAGQLSLRLAKLPADKVSIIDLGGLSVPKPQSALKTGLPQPPIRLSGMPVWGETSPHEETPTH